MFLKLCGFYVHIALVLFKGKGSWIGTIMVFLIQSIWLCNLNFRIVKEMGAIFWNPLLFLWHLLKHSKIVLFDVRATVERLSRWALIKEINEAGRALLASSHFRTDGHTPCVPFSQLQDIPPLREERKHLVKNKEGCWSIIICFVINID